MAAFERKQRWKCSSCKLENRAYRDVCFGNDCNVTRDESKTMTTAAALFSSRQQQQEEDIRCRDAHFEFKDENSKVICRVPSKLATLLRKDLVYMVQELMVKKKKLHCHDDDHDEQSNNNDDDDDGCYYEGSNRKHEDNMRKACALQKQMRKGKQVLEDFEDPVALWGYTRRKFYSRAIVSFELLRSAAVAVAAAAMAVQRHRHHRQQQQQQGEGGIVSDDNDDDGLSSLRNASVVSIGGGPGNDMFGYLLFEKYGHHSFDVASEPLHYGGSSSSGGVSSSVVTTIDNTKSQSSSSRQQKQQQQQQQSKQQHIKTRQLCVWDFAPNWKPICNRVATLSGHDIKFERGDISFPLNSTTNVGICNYIHSLNRSITTAGASYSSRSRSSAEEIVDSDSPDNASPSSSVPVPVTIYLFCYVLNEVMGAKGAPPPLLEDLLKLATTTATTATAKPSENDDNHDTTDIIHNNNLRGTNIFLFREPHRHALERLLNFHPEWKEGEHFWNLSYGGLMVIP